MFEEHIPNNARQPITPGKSYKLTNIQLKLWSGHKKMFTSKQTTITESNDKSLTAIAIKEHDLEDPPTSTD